MKNFVVECIGYKTSFFKERMWFYKVTEGVKEYLIVNAGMIKLLDMIWTTENKFENSDLKDTEYTEIEKLIKKTPKKQNQLEVEKGEIAFLHNMK